MDIACRVEGSAVRAYLGEERVGGISVPEIDFHWGHGHYVRMAGIGGVGTNEAYRSRGIASRMMEEAVRFALDRGYRCSGISTNLGNVARRLYARAGYTTLFRPGWFCKRLVGGERIPDPEGVAVRPYREGDEERLMRAFEEIYAPCFGWRRKTAARWHALRSEIRRTDPEFLFVAEDEDGVQGWAGYFRQWVGLVSELHVRPSPRREAVARTLLRRLEAHLLSREIGEACFWLPPGDPFASAWFAAKGYGFRDQRVFLLSILDLPGLLGELLPLMERRLGETPPWRGVLRIRTPLQRGALRIEERVSVVKKGRADAEIRAPREVLARLVSGVLAPWEAYLEGLLSVEPGMTPELRSLLETLFPRTPWFHPADDLW
jgi:GNAT superfamily N-acetyltransferase